MAGFVDNTDYTNVSFVDLCKMLKIDPDHPTAEGKRRLQSFLAAHALSESNPTGYDPNGAKLNDYLNKPVSAYDQQAQYNLQQQNAQQQNTQNRTSTSFTNQSAQPQSQSQPAEQPQDVPPQESQPQNTPDAMEGDPRYKQRLFDESNINADSITVPDFTKTAEGSIVNSNDLNKNVHEVDERNAQIGEAQAQKMREAAAKRRAAFNSAANNFANWTPLAVSAFGGVDPSGASTAMRNGAGIWDKNAAQNEKIMQWQLQRANDNMLAEKVAAAQAQGNWKQNANSLGAEGGAAVIADQNNPITQDIMAQKNYQKQAMDTATQNLATVNQSKLNAENLRGTANIQDYGENYKNSKNAYTQNLASAKNEQEKKDEEEPEKKSRSAEQQKPVEQAEPAEPKPDTVVEEDANDKGNVAESNKQADAVDTATENAAKQQNLDNLRTELVKAKQDYDKEIAAGKQNTPAAERYNEIRSRYIEAGGDMTDDLYPALPTSFNVGNIAMSINDRNF